VRKKIGVMFGDDEDVAGGNAPKFYASLILHIKRIGTERDGESGPKIANKLAVEPKKNQIAPPFKKAEVRIYYGKGFDDRHATIELAVKLDIMELKGAYYKYKGKTIGQGMKQAKAKLRKDPELFAEIQGKIRKERGW
jgi:recombination protein RecA